MLKSSVQSMVSASTDLLLHLLSECHPLQIFFLNAPLKMYLILFAMPKKLLAVKVAGFLSNIDAVNEWHWLCVVS